MNVVFLPEIQVAGGDEYLRFGVAVLGAFLNAFGIVLQCFGCIALCEAYITHSAINLVEFVLVFVARGHFLQVAKRGGGVVLQLGQMDTGVEIHLPVGLHVDHLLIVCARIFLLARQFVQLRQHVGKTGAVALAFLVLHGNLDVRNSLFVLFLLESKVGCSGGIERGIFALEVVHLYFAKQIIGLVEPV